jgi:hypothetical protein
VSLPESDYDLSSYENDFDPAYQDERETANALSGPGCGLECRSGSVSVDCPIDQPSAEIDSCLSALSDCECMYLPWDANDFGHDDHPS